MSEAATITDQGVREDLKTVLDVKIDRFFYGKNPALREVRLPIYKNQITAFIGPSGCGKSTTLRCINRMHPEDRTRLEGEILLEGQNLYHRNIDPRLVRLNIGMVFQAPNPFRLSVFENVAFGLRLNHFRGDLHERVETALRGAALWDEVKDHLSSPGVALSGGQQQRLCIARAIAVEPEVLLMDEPCSALDPISTMKIEETMSELKKRYTIVIVTHNLHQARRVSDYLAYFMVEREGRGHFGRLGEYGITSERVENPQTVSLRGYLSGEFS